jgi:hypothetical protein
VSSYEEELYRRVDEALFYTWDPIGVAEAINTRDEYSRYVPQVIALLKAGADAQKIAAYLTKVQTEMMGMRVNEGLSLSTAVHLRDLNEWLLSQWPLACDRPDPAP